MTNAFDEMHLRAVDEAWQRKQERKAEDSSSEGKKAADWLTDFAKKPDEALAKRAAERQLAPPPDQNVLIEELARRDRTEYDRMRVELAKTLGIRVGTLDDKVGALRKKMEKEDDQNALPHWKVEPWPEVVDGAALLDSIKQVFRRYIVLPKDADIALALWVLHAWTMDAGDISPFMVLVSPTKRCGKTSVLILLYFLTPKSELASNITASSLFRYIEAVRPTLLIDEADSFVKDNEELRGVLDSGHTKVAANIIRNVEVNGEHKPRRFSTWAPKAIAAIRSLADTLEDRSVIVTLQRKPREAKVERLRRRDTEELKTIRSQVARWAADNFDQLVDPEPKMPEVLNDRAADNWRPLLAIADLAGGAWPEDARRAACLLSGEEQDSAVNVELLRDIRIAFGDEEVISSADLVGKLIADPERPWADWKHGRPLTQKQLGGLLRPFCITSETINLGGGQYAKGYRRVHFEEAWTAYCPGQNALPAPSGTSEPSFRHNADEMGTTSDFRSVSESRGDGSENGKLSYSHAGCDGMTDRRAQNSGQGDFDQGRGPDALDIPYSPRRPPAGTTCAECNDDGGVLEPERANGRLEWLHARCRGYRQGKAAMARNRRPLIPGPSRATTSKQASEQ
jgi:putative DNA primase/helicase